MPLKPYRLSLSRSIFLSTVSKQAEKSRNTVIAKARFSKAGITLSSKEKMAISVFFCFLKPYWSTFNNPVFSKYVLIRLHKIDSKIFDMFDKTEIGRRFAINLLLPFLKTGVTLANFN